MKYLLDTNTCIRFLNKRVPVLIQRFVDTPDEDICVCSIVKAEMFFGSMKSQHPERNRAIQEKFFARYPSLSFDDAAAYVYADIRRNLEQRGTLIGPNDMLIASIARANHLILVTANEREFSRIEGLEIENWEHT